MNASVLDEAALRRRMAESARRLIELGLNRGTSGNIGVRCNEGLLVTPSGMPIDDMTPESMVRLDINGHTASRFRPSSEWRIHRDILAARPEISAVVHTHATFATTLACQQLEIPPFHYMIAAAGGDTIRCAPYALFGSQALSDAALTALEQRKACLLAHHGMIALGRDLDEALAIAVEVEALCEQYWRVLQIGTPKILTEAQMHEVIEQFSRYGQWAANTSSTD
ncbi:MAG: class II aldolase/adducin family protein [Burkholderiaceae bacterium]|nr:class II aldolase/adducin family protein [Burkholderiaceae bacterium]